MASTSKIPDFDDLPAVDGMPQGCAWGIFDEPGKRDDVHGTLNLLTPDVVRKATQEVRDGVSISLNWPLNGYKFDIPGRNRPEHNVIWLPDAGMNLKGWDDEIKFNTQLSSQWDSLCHMHHQETGLAYNGAKCTKETLQNPDATGKAGKLPTIDHWHSRGGLVGRGVLIDFKRYAEEQNIEGFSPASGHRITVEEIEAVAKHQGVEFMPGDVLVVRTGWTQMIDNPTPEDFAQLQKATISGVHGTKETAKWFWNKHFAAVAGDCPSFEAYPPLKEDGSVGENSDLVLHQYFLAMFGLPIGELWDLSRLSEYCSKTGRYSFMLTSVPLNHPGLVASPPNALAIF